MNHNATDLLKNSNEARKRKASARASKTNIDTPVSLEKVYINNQTTPIFEYDESLDVQLAMALEEEERNKVEYARKRTEKKEREQKHFFSDDQEEEEEVKEIIREKPPLIRVGGGNMRINTNHNHQNNPFPGQPNVNPDTMSYDQLWELIEKNGNVSKVTNKQVGFFKSMLTKFSYTSTNALEPCSICTDEFKVNEQVVMLPCLHGFHDNCIYSWLDNLKTTCPVCNFELKDGFSDHPNFPAT